MNAYNSAMYSFGYLRKCPTCGEFSNIFTYVYKQNLNLHYLLHYFFYYEIAINIFSNEKVTINNSSN